MPFRKYKKIEDEYGKPMVQILADLQDQGLTNRSIARRFGIWPETLTSWIKRAGCRTVTRIECDATARDVPASDRVKTAG